MSLIPAKTPTPRRRSTPLLRLVLFSALLLLPLGTLPAQESEPSTAQGTTRDRLADAVLASGAERYQIVEDLANTGDPLVETVLTAWRRGELFLHEVEGAETGVPFLLEDPESEAPSAAIVLRTGEALLDPDGKALSFLAADLTPVDTNSRLRRSIKTTIDVLALSHPEPDVRAEAALKLGLMQRGPYIPILEELLETEQNPKVIENLREGLAVSLLLLGEKEQVIESIQTLDELNSVAGLDFLKGVISEHEKAEGDARDPDILAAAQEAVKGIENYLSVVDMWGTAFRGLSTGSVLLLVALGLAITFGLMGVINMAHGEMIAVGAYAAYLTELMFTKWFGEGGIGAEVYFIFAIPISFLAAAFVGLLLERGIVQFLYRRPLESLLATWGVSLVLQQVFRLVFGAANRQVNSPRWLMGSFEVSDVTLGYNRIFVIFFAILVVALTWLIMNRTSAGLCIRSVMQNRDMAACMGVRTARVRMLTFAFGSGLAGLAGAFLSQIGNVGPNLGQNYIVDSFMVVVAGGVGNIAGTVISAFGIGVTDQVLQPTLGPVMGKICVLVAIILFLQWRPGGLFPARGRSLDD